VNFFRHHVSLPLLLLAAIELAIFAVAPVFGARLLWRGGWYLDLLAGWPLVSYALLNSLALGATGLYHRRQRNRLIGVIVRVGVAIAGGSAAVGLMSYLLPDAAVPRSVLLVAGIIALRSRIADRLPSLHNLGCPLKDRRVLVLGAGGATRGALLPFLAGRPAELVVANRTVDKALDLVSIARLHLPEQAQACRVRGSGYAELAGLSFDVVLNATSASLSGEMPPLSAAVFSPNALAYDLTYGKGMTPFLHLAQEAGVTRLADGVGMLAEQAAEAFAWWRGVRPDTADVIRLITVPLA